MRNILENLGRLFIIIIIIAFAINLTSCSKDAIDEMDIPPVVVEPTPDPTPEPTVTVTSVSETVTSTEEIEDVDVNEDGDLLDAIQRLITVTTTTTDTQSNAVTTEGAWEVTLDVNAVATTGTTTETTTEDVVDTDVNQDGDLLDVLIRTITTVTTVTGDVSESESTTTEWELYEDRADPVDTAEFTEWTAWTPASGNGSSATFTQTRSRECVVTVNGLEDEVAPECDGDVTTSREVADSNYSAPDPVDTAAFSSWSAWTPAQGDGSNPTFEQTRNRTCIVTVNGLADAQTPTCNGAIHETRTVNDANYEEPIDKVKVMTNHPLVASGPGYIATIDVTINESSSCRESIGNNFVVEYGEYELSHEQNNGGLHVAGLYIDVKHHWYRIIHPDGRELVGQHSSSTNVNGVDYTVFFPVYDIDGYSKDLPRELFSIANTTYDSAHLSCADGSVTTNAYHNGCESEIQIGDKVFGSNSSLDVVNLNGWRLITTTSGKKAIKFSNGEVVDKVLCSSISAGRSAIQGSAAMSSCAGDDGTIGWGEIHWFTGSTLSLGDIVYENNHTNDKLTPNKWYAFHNDLNGNGSISVPYETWVFQLGDDSEVVYVSTNCPVITEWTEVSQSGGETTDRLDEYFGQWSPSSGPCEDTTVSQTRVYRYHQITSALISHQTRTNNGVVEYRDVVLVEETRYDHNGEQQQEVANPAYGTGHCNEDEFNAWVSQFQSEIYSIEGISRDFAIHSVEQTSATEARFIYKYSDSSQVEVYVTGSYGETYTRGQFRYDWSWKHNGSGEVYTGEVGKVGNQAWNMRNTSFIGIADVKYSTNSGGSWRSEVQFTKSQLAAGGVSLSGYIATVTHKTPVNAGGVFISGDKDSVNGKYIYQ